MKNIVTEKENALRIMKHRESPEWVPLSNDCLKLVIPSVSGERPDFGTDGEDWFGCSWIWDGDCFGHAPEVRKEPFLDDIVRWRDVVQFPDLDAIDWNVAAEKDLEDFNRDEQLLRIMMETGPFERTHAFLGFENTFIAMCEEPEELKALIDAIADFKVKLIDKICEYYKPDDIMFQDDLGTSQGPMMSLEMYRELLKPAHKKIGDAIRSYGVNYTHHSCGRMEAFIDDLIDVGVQMINPIQPVNDYATLAEKYADSMIFEVGVDSVACYANSTEDAIRQNVREVVDIFGPHNNLMLICYPSNVHAMQNFEIAIDEAKRYGSNFYVKK